MILDNKKKMALYIVAVFFVILDRFLKFLAVNGYFDDPISIIGDIFKLSFTSNFNIAFSLPISGAWLNVVISLMIIFLLVLVIRLCKNKDYLSAHWLLIVVFGAASNLYDRLKFGFVIDYLDLKYFTVFNLADAMIVGGVIGFGWLMVKENKWD